VFFFIRKDVDFFWVVLEEVSCYTETNSGCASRYDIGFVGERGDVGVWVEGV